MNNEKDKDGYRLIGGVEVNGKIGVRILVKAPDDMYQVFNWSAMREQGRMDCYVDPYIEKFIERIETAGAMLDPKTAENQVRERVEFTNIFMAAGFQVVHARQIPNEYCSKHCCLGIPWFIMTTTMGPIKIGWRKRVMSIEWHDSDIKTDGEVLFADMDVTKGKTYIHAWSPETTVEYLHKLRISHLNGGTTDRSVV